MLLYCGLLLICLNCVRTTEYVYDYGLENSATEWNSRFSYWPSLHNALARLQKRDIVSGQSEGGSVLNNPPASENPPSLHPAITNTTNGGTTTKTAIQTTTTPSHEPSVSNDIPSNPKTESSGLPKGIFFHIDFTLQSTNKKQTSTLFTNKKVSSLFLVNTRSNDKGNV